MVKNSYGIGRIALQPNEFTDNTDMVGFFEQDYDPTEFLSVDTFTSSTTKLTLEDRDSIPLEVEGDEVQIRPKMKLDLILSNRMVITERGVYTFFTLLGDLGGFNGAITIFPAYIMSYYASRMYQKSVAADTPIRKPRKRNKHESAPCLPARVFSGQDSLSQEDIMSIFKQVRMITRQKVPFWKSLCNFSSLCSHDREIRLMNKVTSRFEE